SFEEGGFDRGGADVDGEEHHSIMGNTKGHEGARRTQGNLSDSCFFVSRAFVSFVSHSRSLASSDSAAASSARVCWTRCAGAFSVYPLLARRPWRVLIFFS